MANNGYSVYEYVNIDSNQGVISTSQRYIDGSIIIEDSIQNSSDFTGSTFTKVDNNNIMFDLAFTEPQTMVLKYSALSNGLFNDIVSNNNSNPNAVFKKYGTDTKLQFNNKYFVHIAFVESEAVEFKFTSETNPRFTSIKKIRGDTGDLLDSTTDEEINNIIYANSKELQFIIEDKERTSGAISDESQVLRSRNAYKFWVRYKTDLDLVNAIYLSICGQFGVNMKKIGDIQISKEFNVANLQKMLSRFSELYLMYDETVNTSEEPAVSFTKAVKTNTYQSRGVF